MNIIYIIGLVLTCLGAITTMALGDTEGARFCIIMIMLINILWRMDA